VVAGVVAPDAIASGIRAVFGRATLTPVLALSGAVVVLALVRLPRFGPRLPRSVPWGVGVAAIAAVAGVTWYALGRATAVPHVFADELLYANLARGVADDGTLATAGYGIVTPAVDAIAYLATADDVGAYRLIQALNVALMVTAAFPAYLLARRALSHGWSLAVAGFTVALPWMGYSSLVMTEAAFYPVFLLFMLAFVRALEWPTPGRQAVLALALVAAFATRAQAIVLAGAVVAGVLLYGAVRRETRALLRAFLPTWALYAVGGLAVLAAAASDLWNPLGVYDVLLYAWRPRALWLYVAAHTTAFAVGLGVLVVVAAPLGAAALLRRAAARAETALAAASISATALLVLTVVVLSASPHGGGGVHERNLFYAVPLVLICALAWATRGFPRPRLVTAATVLAAIVLALEMPPGLITGQSVDALSFKLWTQVSSDPEAARWPMVAAVAIGALLLVRIRSAWPLVATLVVFTVAVAAAGDHRSDRPRSETDRYAWVDPVASGDVALLWIGYDDTECATVPIGKLAVYTEFFNSSVDTVGHLLDDNDARALGSDALELTADGVVTRDGVPLRPVLVVTDARAAVAGERLATLDSLSLWRTSSPVRLVRAPAAGEACAPAGAS
jgi:hypothetical protein